jgi:hypothetical protein
MKHFTQTLIAVMGLIVISTVAVLADNSTPAVTPTHSSGNQPMQGPTRWYEKAALTTGPADTAAKGGLVLQAGSVLYLEGDSTPQKYRMNANVLLGSAVMKDPKAEPAKALQADGVDSMTLVVPVNNLKSRESGLDDNAYKALQAKENPTIQFVLESETLKGDLMTAKGDLTIAGTTLPITLSAQTEIKGDRIHLKGVQKLKMSDYKVKPPSISLLVTSITCKDEVDIHYDVTFAAE